jgi:hypothetical protein
MKKQPYKWGASAWLRSMEIGETRAHDGTYRWRTLQVIAARIERDFHLEVEFVFSTRRGKKYVTRLR